MGTACKIPLLGQGELMRSVEDYLRHAADFERLARESKDPSLQKRFADVAGCYRILADERQRMIAEGIIESDGVSRDQSGSSSGP